MRMSMGGGAVANWAAFGTKGTLRRIEHNRK